MRPKRVAVAVGLLVLVMVAGAWGTIELRVRRVHDSTVALEKSLAPEARRDAFPPALDGKFSDCAEAPKHDIHGPLEGECQMFATTGGEHVPAACQAILDSGDRWVDAWLRCSQRRELGPPHLLPTFVHSGDTEAAYWLALHLQTVPPKEAVDECRLVMAHARDLAWSFGPSGCTEALNELLYSKVPCGVALERVEPGVRAAFLAEARSVRSQLPEQRWFRQHGEVHALQWFERDVVDQDCASKPRCWWRRFEAKLAFPGLKRHYDDLISRDPPLSSAISEEGLFNPVAAVLSNQRNCETLPKGYDLLIELASINP